MAAWKLVPCLEQLRAEFNEIAPGRDRSSDGTIGDQAHADRVSSHNPDETGAVPVRDADKVNEVHALDVDVDLRTDGLTMEMVVQHLVVQHRAGLEDRLRNIIFNRRIWAASSGWVRQPYTGANPHDKHAHFEASYSSQAEADIHSWHLEDIPVALTAADKQWISAEIKKVIISMFAVGEQADGTPTSKIGRDAWSQGIPNGLVEKTPRDQAWEVLRDLGTALGKLAEDVADIKAQSAPSAGK